MNVADLTLECKSEADTLLAAEALKEIDSLVAQLKQSVAEGAATGGSFDSVERMIKRGVLQLGRQLLDLLLRLQGDGDLGAEVSIEEGQTLRRSKRKHRTEIRSIFGEHCFEQFVYSPGPKKAIQLRPVSARLLLPHRKWSYLLQELSQTLAVDSSYQQTVETLGCIFGGRFSVDTTEQVNGELGRAAGEYLSDLPTPDPESEAKFLAASGDCKGVPLVKEDAAKVAAFEKAKKAPGNRRMATVASVYSVDPHVRTAEDVVAALFREEPSQSRCKPTRPKPKNKITTAHLPEIAEADTDDELSISGIHVAMAWIAQQVITRRRKGQVLLVLMDGQESLWEAMQLHLSFGARTIPVLDILHALTYLWEAAGLFEHTDAGRRAFTRVRCLRLLRGEVHGVIRGLRRLAALRGLQGQAAKDIARICRYFENNADRMRYDEYLRRGYPIATGVIEGACRHLVKDRMERSGMRWTLEGARAMLHARAASQSDHWQDFLHHRIKIDVVTNHKHKDLLTDYQPMTLAC